MSNTQELRFQGLCLVNSEGYRYMTDYYDPLPEIVRDRLRSSSYNLCAACVQTEAYRRPYHRDQPPTVQDYLKVISNMEQELQQQERNQHESHSNQP